MITSQRAKTLMFSQQQIPADRRAKAPTGDPYLAQVSKAFRLVADDDGLLLYTDWASPSMYTTLQNQFQLLLAGRRPRPAWRRPSRTTGRSSTRRFADPHAWRVQSQPRRSARTPPVRRFAEASPTGLGSRAGRPAQHRLALRPPGSRVLRPVHARLLHTVYYSLFDWDGLTGKTWVGLSNYGERSATRCSGHVRPLGDPDRVLRGLPGDHRAPAHGCAHAHRDPRVPLLPDDAVPPRC